jgi:hypothetical protein
MIGWVHTRPQSASDVTRTGLGLHERTLACVDGWERFMSEVLSKMRSSMIVPQGDPLLATGFCLRPARLRNSVTLQPFHCRTRAPSRLGRAASQAHCP